MRPHLQAGNLQEIVDPELASDSFSMESMWKVVEVAMASVEPKESHRPNMQEVVQELRQAASLEQQRHLQAKTSQVQQQGQQQRQGTGSSNREALTAASGGRGDVNNFTDTSQESMASRYSMPSPR